MSKTFNAPVRDGMEHETIFALRMAEGWRIHARDCPPDDLDARLRDDGLADLERRIIVHHHIHPAAREVYCGQYARGNGWQKHPTKDIWFPMDEPLPPLPGSPPRGDVAIRLDRICYSIHWSIICGNAKISPLIDDLDDSLTLWVRFIRMLENGGNPHAVLCQCGPTHVIVQETADPTECRFYVCHYRAGAPQTIDVIMSRATLVEQFRAFLACIADHPLLAHFYLCCDVPDEQFDLVYAAAETEWKTIAADQALPEDNNGEMEEDFVHARVAAAVPIPEVSRPWVDKFKTMLKTLEIPEDWQ